MNTQSERLFEVKEQFISEPIYQYYDQAKKSFGWEMTIDWDSSDWQSSEQADYAWRLASQSSYAEQLGMIIAARLLCDATDYTVRLYLASAVQDEARHIEVFSRYALKLRGYVAPPEKQDIIRINEQISAVQGFLPQFLAHTTLESFAADSFLYFADYFQDNLLGQLYRLVHRDETRHVAAGLAYLRTKAREAAEYRKEIENHIDIVREIGDLGESGYDGLAKMSGQQNPDQIRKNMLKRYDHRIRTIFE